MPKPAPNKLLSDYLKSVGEEKTETVAINGETRIVSKAEAVARTLYQQATGGLFDVVDPKTGELIQVYIKPVVAAAKILREFTEGKAGTSVTEDPNPKQKAGRYSADTRKRLEEVLQQADEKEAKKRPPRPTLS
jgi:hypothetical protein